MSDLVFEVIGPDGHKWSVYSDGRISGFPGGSIVINRIPLLSAQEALGRPMNAEAWPTRRPADDGLEQGLAPHFAPSNMAAAPGDK